MDTKIPEDDWLGPCPDNRLVCSWEDLVHLDLVGKEIRVSDGGGDICEIIAVITEVLLIPQEIIFRIKDAVISDGRKESEKPLIGADKIVISLSDELPIINEKSVVLPTGGTCLNQVEDLEWGGGYLAYGFITL